MQVDEEAISSVLNRLRRAYPALQTHLNLSFYKAGNDRILYFGKRVPGSAEMILVAISLDPHNAQDSGFELPLSRPSRTVVWCRRPVRSCLVRD